MESSVRRKLNEKRIGPSTIPPKKIKVSSQN